MWKKTHRDAKHRVLKTILEAKRNRNAKHEWWPPRWWPLRFPQRWPFLTCQYHDFPSKVSLCGGMESSEHCCLAWIQQPLPAGILKLELQERNMFASWVISVTRVATQICFQCSPRSFGVSWSNLTHGLVQPTSVNLGNFHLSTQLGSVNSRPSSWEEWLWSRECWPMCWFGFHDFSSTYVVVWWWTWRQRLRITQFPCISSPFFCCCGNFPLWWTIRHFDHTFLAFGLEEDVNTLRMILCRW